MTNGMQTIQVSKVQMQEIYVADGFRWVFLSQTTKAGWETYQRESPFADALSHWKNTRDVCPRCQTQRCPDGCCCGC